MQPAPTPDSPRETDAAKLAKPVPLCQTADGELVLIAITPAVAALARVARSIFEERRARRLQELSRPWNPANRERPKGAPRNLPRRRRATTD